MTDALRSFANRFLVLQSAPRELWVIYLAKLLAIASYALTSTVLTLWLSSDLGMSDARAGDVVAIWSTVITLTTLLVGSLVDAIGVRRAFLMGFVILLFSRAIVAVGASPWLVLPAGLLVMAVGEALMVPVMTAGVKRFSNVAQRSMAFSLFYVLMNVGYLISGSLFDHLRTALGEYGGTTLPLVGAVSTYRVILVVAFLFVIPGFLLTLFLLRGGVTMTEEGVRVEPEKLKYEGSNPLSAMARLATDTGRETLRIFAGVWKQKNFYKFLLFLTFIVFVRLVFYHMHFTFPKYGIRELGEGAPVGRLWGVLNPAIIILLVPVVGALSQKISSYRMVTFGTLIAAVPVFLLALPASLFQPLADGFLGQLIGHTWLGIEGPVHPLYVSITLFVVVFSVGEAFWSPRLYEYTASIAPKDQVGSYMALSLLPYFVAKLGVGVLSGRLLEWFCPAEGPRNSETMWLIIAGMAAICPLGLLVFRRFVQSREEGR